MNAIQFIKDHGVEKAREVVEGAPSNAESYQDDYYFRTKPEFQFHNGFHPVWNLTDNDGEWFKKKGFSPVAITDLKRLVDSIDLITSYGGIINAQHEIKYLDLDWDYDSPRVVQLKQAIADY
ncbi:hypothetical protein, partial [Acinetobacter haemolyticus]|uniref:hypothetical protein n=1 Tax=Acinetobacter haemolyticus TaxID=29430 RepID=UPI001D1979A8